MHPQKILISAILIAAVVGSIVYLNSQKAHRAASGEKVELAITMNKEEKAKRYPAAKEITTPDGFINTPSTSSGQATPITVGEFIGKKVVLIDFWTYSCINCQRTIPYLNEWHKKYADKGLTIIGVHTPEFAFEKDYENVQKAVHQFGIRYPVVLDNDYSTWHAYKNRYWPRKYLIDIDGFVVYDHIGEGGYEETERKIQELLHERMETLGIRDSLDQGIAQPSNVEEVDLSQERSPEVYFGATRNTHLGNGNKNTVGLQTLIEPDAITTNLLYLTGDWEFAQEQAENRSLRAKIIFRYRAEKVFFVAGSAHGTRIMILRDGKMLGEEAAEDIEQDSMVYVQENRLYRIIDDPAGYGEHTLEMIIDRPGLQAFTFTFG